jgi:hypothetical protein
MPPQQDERLLDLGDDCFGFGAHIRDQVSEVRDQENRGAGIGGQIWGVNGTADPPMPDI